MTRLAVIGGALVLAACSRGPAPPEAPGPAAAPTIAPARDLTGRWTGVEGMFLDVTSGKRPGEFRLTMQYDLDHRQTTTATLEGGALVFSRDGERKALKPTNGDATGLKHLAGKTDCLTVAPGEGYCR